MTPLNVEQLKINLSRNLRYLRLRKNPPMSQKNLAQRIGVTQKSITRYESGICLPPTPILLAMSQYFGYTMTDLLSDRLPEKEGVNNNK